MGMGSEMMDDAMIDQMVAEDLAEYKTRAQMFQQIEQHINKAGNIEQLKSCLVILLGLIKEQR